MSESPTSLPPAVDADFEAFSDICGLPAVLEDDARRILQSAVTEGYISGTPSTAEIVAVALLTKRLPVAKAKREAKQFAVETNNSTLRDILDQRSRFDARPIETPPKDGTIASFVDALEIAAETLPVDDLQESSVVEEWREETGIGKNDNAVIVTCRQTALLVTLRSIVFDETATIDTNEITRSEYLSAVAEAHEELGDRSPDAFVLDSLVDRFPESVFDWLVELRHYVEHVDDPCEFLGCTYEELVEQEERWRLGQFRTPPELATLVARLGLGDERDTVLAPGLGAGAIAAAASTIKHDTHRLAPLDDLHGVELSPLSLLLGSAALTELPVNGTPSLYNMDFFDMEPADVPAVDTVLVNPPYTKHHELTSTEKAALHDYCERATGFSFSKLSPMYVYFTVHAAQFLTPGDRAVFLTPAEILNTEYGTEWKEFLQEEFDIEAMVLFDQNGDSPFGDVATTSLITVGERKDSSSETSETVFARVDEMSDPDVIASPLQDQSPPDTSISPSWGYLTTVAQTELDPGTNWSVYFDEFDPVIDDRLVPLSSLAHVTRGIATGQNAFFCLSDNDRSGSGNGESWEIDEEFLTPVIRKSHKVPYYDYRESDWDTQRAAGTEAWMLYHLDELEWDSRFFAQEIADEETAQQQLTAFSVDDSDVDPSGESELSSVEKSVVAYLKYGMQLEEPPHKTHLAQHRDTWYEVERREPPDILYTSMTRGRGRFVYNEMRARNLNNVHALYLTEDLSEDEVKALLAYLNSEFADQIIKQSGRTLSSGMSKVEPGDLKNIPVIDPREVDSNVVEELASLFDDLCEAARADDDGIEQDVRMELRKALQSYLDG